MDTAHGWSLTPLGISILRSQSIVTNANHISGTNFLQGSTNDFDINWHLLNYKLKDNKKVRNNDTALAYRKDFGRFLQMIYYTGKNWCFSKEHEPLNELKSIQNRIDLSRSMVLLLTFSIQLLLCITIVNFFYRFYPSLKIRRRNGMLWQKGDIGKISNLLQLNFLIAFFIVFLISKECYDINEDNYNKRAYGYYVSEVNRTEYLRRFKDTTDTKAIIIKKE